MFDEKKFALLFEKGEFDAALKVLEHSKWFCSIKQAYPDEYDILTAACLRAGKKKKDLVYRERNDLQFAEYTKGKTVTIIAPGFREDFDTLKKYLNKDDNNIYALLSYLFDGTQKEITDRIKPDIVFYNHDKFRRLLAGREKDRLAGIKFMPHKPADYELAPKDAETFRGKLREMYPKNALKYFMLNGSFNLLQCACLDLLFFDVQIKILNADLFYSRTQYMGGVNPFSGWYNRMETFYQHDMVLNYRLTHAFYRNNLFVCDDELMKIMELGETGYVKGIETMYMNHYENT